jgi:catechol 2,3-dioxygenase-like lactoylglutathione lyase family enzyme
MMQLNPVRLGHVNLRVRDPDASSAFYCGLVGLVQLERSQVGGSVRLALPKGDGSSTSAVIVLTPGLPCRAELLGVDHFAFEVPTVQDVYGAYRRAREMDAQAIRPRVYDGHWQTFVFDPDGYKVEVLTQDRPEQPAVREFSTERTDMFPDASDRQTTAPAAQRPAMPHGASDRE